MRHQRIIALLLALAAATLPDAAAQSRIDLSVLGAEDRVMTPGGVGTVLFRVTNDRTDSTSVSLGIDVQAGWSIIGRPAPVRLAPGESKNQLVAFKSAANSLPDSSRITVHALAANGDTLASRTAPISVSAKRSLSITTLAGTRAATSGQEYTLRFAVTNSGNVRQSVDLDVRNTLGFALDFTPRRLNLAPFSSDEVVVVVRPDDRFSGETSITNIYARGDGPKELVASARAQSSTEILRRGRTKPAIVPRIPVRLALSAAGTANASAQTFDLSIPQFDLAGGTLSAMMRGPNVQSVGPFSMQDYYQVSYRRGDFSVRLGDQYQRQTELVTNGMAGFGASTSGKIGRVAASAYALETRSGFPTRSRQGITASLPLNEAWIIRLNGAAEQYGVNSFATSLRAEWNPGAMTALHAEYGFGGFNGQSGQGVSAGFRSAGRPGRFDVRYSYASADFPGSFRGSSQLTGSASVTMTSFLTVDANYGRYRSAYDFTRSMPTGNDLARIGATGAFRVGRKFRFQTSISGNTRDRSSSLAEMNRDEAFVAATTSTGYGPITARFDLERGILNSSESSRPFTKSNLNLHLRYGPFVLSANYAVERGARVFFPIDARRIQVGASLQVQVARSLQTDLKLYSNSIAGTIKSRNDFGELEVQYTLPFGHVLSVQGRYSRYNAQTYEAHDLAGGMTYRIPIDVPTRRPVPGLSGRVILADSGLPVRDAIVRVGSETLLTDDKGRFEFATTQGADRVEVETSLVDPALVVLNTDALLLVEGSSPRLDRELLLVRGGTLAGRFRLEDTSDKLTVRPDASQRDLETAGLAVVVSNGTEERHAMTQMDGSFKLYGLPPGTWRVHAVASTIPGSFKAERTVTAEIVAGNPVEVILPVELRTRTIRMIASASLALRSKDTTTVVAKATSESVASADPRADERKDGDPRKDAFDASRDRQRSNAYADRRADAAPSTTTIPAQPGPEAGAASQPSPEAPPQTLRIDAVAVAGNGITDSGATASTDGIVAFPGAGARPFDQSEARVSATRPATAPDSADPLGLLLAAVSLVVVLIVLTRLPRKGETPTRGTRTYHRDKQGRFVAGDRIPNARRSGRSSSPRRRAT